jgi:hypothetical protein
MQQRTRRDTARSFLHIGLGYRRPGFHKLRRKSGMQFHFGIKSLGKELTAAEFMSLVSHAEWTEQNRIGRSHRRVRSMTGANHKRSRYAPGASKLPTYAFVDLFDGSFSNFGNSDFDLRQFPYSSAYLPNPTLRDRFVLETTHLSSLRPELLQVA